MDQASNQLRLQLGNTAVARIQSVLGRLCIGQQRAQLILASLGVGQSGSDGNQLHRKLQYAVE